MKIAYIISAYDDSSQLKKLVSALHADADYYIHIDARVSDALFKKDLEGVGNVYFTPKRYFVNWGSFSQVLYQIEMLRCVLESGVQYERVVCLSGMDYPIWSNIRITEEFLANPEKQYIVGYNISNTSHVGQRERITLYHFFRDIMIKDRRVKRCFSGPARIIMRLLPVRKRPQVLLDGNMVDVYYGSDYWALTIDCARYVYKKFLTNNDYVEYFKYSFVPSEMCVQTIIFNSVYAKHAVVEREEDFTGLPRLTPLHHIVYTKRVKIFTECDYDELICSGKMFFRKSATGLSEELLRKIDEYRGSCLCAGNN